MINTINFREMITSALKALVKKPKEEILY